MTERHLICALLALLLVPVAYAQQARQIVSSDMLADGRVTFRLNAPRADEVILTGEFLDGPRNFVKDADGVWSVTVGPVAPEVYQALSIGLNNLDLFSFVGGFSSGLGSAANYPKTYARLVANADEANKRLKLVWIGFGKEDRQFAQSKSLSELLTANNVKHTFRETSGAHTWMVWRRYLHEISPLLFR